MTPKLTINRNDARESIRGAMSDTGIYTSQKQIFDIVAAMGDDEIIKKLQRILRSTLGRVDIELV